MLIFAIIVYLIGTYFLVFWFLSILEGDFKYPDVGWKKMKDFPSMSVIIPAYNEEGTIRRTLNSVLALDYPEDKLDIVVVDDGSKDKTSEVAQKIMNLNPARHIRLIRQENKGKGAALNKALESIQTKYFACLDADSEVDKHSLKKMINLFERRQYLHKNLAIVTPALRVQKPKNLVQRIQYFEYLITMLLARVLSNSKSIYVAPGPFSVYKTSIIKDLGGFDENNLTEDQEIAYRVKENKYELENCSDAYVYTNAPDSLKSLFYQRNRWYKGALMNAWKYRKLMFNKEYGHFGSFQMPLNFMTYFLSASALFLFFYYTIKPLFKHIKDLFLVNFDVIPFLKDLFRFNFNVLDFNPLIGIFIIFSLAVFVYLFHKISKEYKEKLSRKNLIGVGAYLFVYFLFLGLVVVFVLFDLSFGRIQKW
jgi:cellulose synthase/poly-beta-1,6-N-acetylglucosamine synthase-like glycosyltransferase